MELLLEWETYLNEPEMAIKHVKRLEKKHWCIMCIMQKVSPREDGMGLKLMKFHAILHVVEDILLFGAPSEFDTGSNESHHKSRKQAARLTQHDLDTFHFQMATCLVEFLLVDLALWEIEQEQVVWDYFAECEESDDESMEDAGAEEGGEGPETATGEAQIIVGVDPEMGDSTWKLKSWSKCNDKANLNSWLVDFLAELQCKVAPHLPTKSMDIFTFHEQDGQKFQAHPNYHGKGPW